MPDRNKEKKMLKLQAQRCSEKRYNEIFREYRGKRPQNLNLGPKELLNMFLIKYKKKNSIEELNDIQLKDAILNFFVENPKIKEIYGTDVVIEWAKDILYKNYEERKHYSSFNPMKVSYKTDYDEER